MLIATITICSFMGIFVVPVQENRELKWFYFRTPYLQIAQFGIIVSISAVLTGLILQLRFSIKIILFFLHFNQFLHKRNPVMHLTFLIYQSSKHALQLACHHFVFTAMSNSKTAAINNVPASTTSI